MSTQRMQIQLPMLMRRLKKPLIWSAAVFAVVLISAVLGLPPLLKSVLIKRLSAALHREVSIQKVTVNPFRLSITVSGFLVTDRGVSDRFASFDELFVNLEAISALRLAPVVREMRLSQPFIRIIRHPDKTYNFSDLLGKNESQKDRAATPLRFSLNNIRIVNGSIDLWDEPKQKKHTVRDLNLSVPFISSFPSDVETFVEPAFSTKINDTQYSLEGKTKPLASSRETSLDIRMNNFDLAYYFPYVPMETAFTILSGYVDAQVKVSFLQQANGQRALALKGDLAIKQLSMNDAQNNTLLRLPLLNISLASAEPFSRLYHVAKVSLQSPELHVRRDRSGVFNLASLFPKTQEAQEASPTESKTTPLSLLLDEIGMEDGKISFFDLSRASSSDTAPGRDGGRKMNRERRKRGDQVTLTAEDIDLRVESLSTKEGQKSNVSLAFRPNQKGQVGAKGSIALNPRSAELALTVSNVDLRPVQPYFSDRVNIIVTNGRVSTSGNLSLTDRPGTGPQISYKGAASVTQFSSIDKAHAEDFLRWQSLSLGGLAASYDPFYLHIQTVALTDFFARVILHADGSLNLAQAFKVQPAHAASPATAKSPTPDTPSRAPDKGVRDVRINRITLQGGRINFSDHFVKPNYSANLVGIGGRISGLSADERATADVELRGNLDQHAPLEITGKINPLRRDLLIDLKARFRDMDLSAMTPYSGKYVGYTIQKGKLAFDVSYLVVKRKLEAQNTVFIDQLTLGDKVESPHATNLPVGLAIALLKDRNGEIRLDIPVAGHLDEPQFSIWKIIVQIIGNLLTKAATSPFALLGAALGGGEELAYLEFDDGSSALTEPNLKKLDALIKALHERPSLKLEIEGHVDAEKDREGLKQYLFNRRVKAQKLKDQLKQGVPVAPVDEVHIEPHEYEKYLRMAYKAEKFPKPRNILGFEKTVPVSEMEKLMLTNLVVTDDDMRSLASQRAMRTKDLILKSGRVNPERVFIIVPKSLSPERREKVKDGRVDLRISV